MGGGGPDPQVDLAAHGRARASSASSTTRSTAAPAPTSSPPRCSARRWPAARCALAGDRRCGVHTDMASPHLYWTGSEALKERVPARRSAAARRSDRHRGHRARRRLRHGGDPDARGAGRRPLRAERVEDVHHQRRDGGSLLRGRADRTRGTAERAPRRDLDVPGGARHAGLHGEPQARQDGQCAPPTPPSWPSRTCRVPAENLLGRGRRRLLRGHAACFQRERLGGGAARGRRRERRRSRTRIAYVRERQAFDGPLSRQAGAPPPGRGHGHRDRGGARSATYAACAQVPRPARSA